MRRVALFALIVLTTLACVVALWELQHAVSLLALSLATASAVAPIVSFFTTRGLARPSAVALSYGAGVAVLGVLLWFMAAPLVSDIQGTVDQIVRTYETFRATDGGFFHRSMVARLPVANIEGTLDDSTKLAEAAVGAFGLTLTAVSILADLGIVIVLSIFWSLNSCSFERLWLSLLPVAYRSHARDGWDAIQCGVGGRIRSDLVLSLLAVLLLALGFRTMGLAFQALPAVAGGVLRLVPVVGTFLSVAVAVVSELTADPVLAAGAGLYVLVVLSTLHFIVAPKLHARRYNPLLVTFTVIALSNVYGLEGLLVAPALAAAVQIFFESLLASLRATAPPEASVAAVEERLRELRLLVAGRGPALPGPELVNVVERVSRLVEAVELESAEGLAGAP